MKKLFAALIMVLLIAGSATAVNDFYLRNGDTGPYYYAQITDKDGAVDLSGATVTFSMRSLTGTAKVTDQSVTISDAANGYIEYHWQAADTDWSTTFLAEFSVTLGGLEYTFPSKGSARVIITDNFSY